MIQYVIIALLVIWSAIVVFKKVLPKSYNHLTASIANYCEQKGWLKLARWFTPKALGGCAGGCGCSIDEKSTVNKTASQPVKWH